jgi:hypothetical protein
VLEQVLGRPANSYVYGVSPPVAVTFRYTVPPVSSISGYAVKEVMVRRAMTVAADEATTGEVPPNESWTDTETVYPVPEAVGVHVMLTAFARSHPRDVEDSVQTYLTNVPLPPLGVVLKAMLFPTSTLAGLGDGDVTLGRLRAVYGWEISDGVLAPFESVTTTVTV